MPAVVTISANEIYDFCTRFHLTQIDSRNEMKFGKEESIKKLDKCRALF